MTGSQHGGDRPLLFDKTPDRAGKKKKSKTVKIVSPNGQFKRLHGELLSQTATPKTLSSLRHFVSVLRVLKGPVILSARRVDSTAAQLSGH